MPRRRGYSFKKALTDRGVHRGAHHAFRPPQRPGEPNIVLTDERLRVHRNVFWFGAALIYGVAGSVVLCSRSSLSGAAAGRRTSRRTAYSPIAIAVALTSIALAGFWLYMASRDAHAMPWLNAIIGIGTALIAVVVVSSEDFRPEHPAVLPVAGDGGCLLSAVQAGARRTWSRSRSIEIYVAYNSTDIENGKLIALNVLFFTLMGAAMLMVARKRIQDGIVHNVALAGRDPLTGVANLRKFNERLQTEIDRAERSGDPLTLLMIDLDEFKLVNDHYSYTLGDAVLVASARAMSRVVRANELLARRGGDEFAVIAVGADAEESDALAERIRDAVRRERLKLCPGVTPEASVGVAEWRPGESAVELIAPRRQLTARLEDRLAHRRAVRRPLARASPPSGRVAASRRQVLEHLCRREPRRALLDQLIEALPHHRHRGGGDSQDRSLPGGPASSRRARDRRRRRRGRRPASTASSTG